MTRVLVVDDNPVDRRLVGGLLKKDATLEVDFAANGADALAKIEARPPHLVVTDLIMPEMSGLDLVTAVRGRFSFVPTILMTSRGNEEIAVQALRSGAASYVPKAKLAQALLETVRSVLSAATEQQSITRVMASMTSNECEFTLENDPSLVTPLVAYLQECATRLQLYDEKERVRVGIALEEAIANALYHGNLEVSSDLRENDYDSYYALAKERRAQPPFAERRIHVTARLTATEGVFVVRDEGPGFDCATLVDPTDPANLERVTGRGLLLMKTFMDEVSHNELGNEVRLVKRREGACQLV